MMKGIDDEMFSRATVHPRSRGRITGPAAAQHPQKDLPHAIRLKDQ
jgi:hypothetical protein